MDTTRQLRSTQLLSDLDSREIERLAAIATSRKVLAGSMLFLDGDTATGFFVLLDGQVRIFKSAPDGREYTLHVIEPGQMFAEAAIFRGDTFPASCQALVDSEVVHFPKREFVELVTHYPQIALKIIARLSTWLREFTHKLENLSLREVPARLAWYLLRQRRIQGIDQFRLPTSKSELAKELGTIPETLSRSLRKLKTACLIAEVGDRVEIRDPEALAELASGEKPRRI